MKAPTLVIHSRGDAVSPFEEGRQIAATIPDARLVALEGDNHCSLQGNRDWGRMFGEINSFLKAPSAASPLRLLEKR